MSSNVKYNIIKYTFLVSSLIFSVLMFCKWFEIWIKISGTETHSFLTIPGFINDLVETFKSYVGAAATFMVLLLAGILEYLCIVSAALGIWGIIRTLMKKRRSRLLLASQIISVFLVILAVSIIIIVNVISNSQPLLEGLLYIRPTLELVYSLLSLIVSVLTGFLYNRINAPIAFEQAQTQGN